MPRFLVPVAAASTLLLIGCAADISPAAPGPSANSRATAPSSPVARPGTALAALASVRVKGRAPRTGYDRSQFGQAWADVDRNGCDTRNDVLRRDLHDTVLRAGTRGCVVLRGTLDDPYTGRTLPFARGWSTSSAVQIDHLVALSNAWQTGAQSWTPARREQLANDPLNLLAVDGPTNLAKGDGDAATWLPPQKSYRCAYVARQVAVKVRYGLWVTAPERQAVMRVLAACPGTRLPAAAPLVRGPASTRPYAGCTAVRAAGAAPLHVGDAGYSRALDRDGDGTACE